MNIDTLPKSAYPRLWQEVERLPESMDIIGTMPSDDHRFICIIGSRTHSTYGAHACETLIRGLAGYPIVIVSGLAIGIDSIAHETALTVGLKTVAFPGSGLSPEVIYPRSRQSLARRIVEAGGALVSRFPHDAVAQNWMFPVRNALMAGLSHAVLIIEGREGSGTLGTATYAEQFNRDVLAVPGSIFSDLSYGPHMLIRDGATPITSAHDILEAVGFSADTTVAGDDRASTLGIPFEPQGGLILPPDERAIYSALGTERQTADDLISKTSLTPSIFNAAISELEIKGLIRERGGIYSLAR